jgi:hypothetical protein
LKWESVSLYQERESALKAQIEDLQRQLDNARTDWLCDTCNGRGCEAENQNTILLAELEKLQRDNAVLRADKERLDWLAVSDEWFDVPEAESFIADTFRAAIDAARKEQPCQS